MNTTINVKDFIIETLGEDLNEMVNEANNAEKASLLKATPVEAFKLLLKYQEASIDTFALIGDTALVQHFKLRLIKVKLKIKSVLEGKEHKVALDILSRIGVVIKAIVEYSLGLLKVVSFSVGGLLLVALRSIGENHSFKEEFSAYSGTVLSLVKDTFIK